MISPISNSQLSSAAAMQGIREANSAADAVQSFALSADPTLKPLQATTAGEKAEVQEKFQEFMAG